MPVQEIPIWPAHLTSCREPGDLIDPIAQAMMKMFLSPLRTCRIQHLSQLDHLRASRYPNDQFDIKIDHRFNENNLMSAKYSQEWNSASRITAS